MVDAVADTQIFTCATLPTFCARDVLDMVLLKGFRPKSSVQTFTVEFHDILERVLEILTNHSELWNLTLLHGPLYLTATRCYASIERLSVTAKFACVSCIVHQID